MYGAGVTDPVPAPAVGGDITRAVTPPDRDDWNIGGDCCEVGADDWGGIGAEEAPVAIRFLFDLGI